MQSLQTQTGYVYSGLVLDSSICSTDRLLLFQSYANTLCMTDLCTYHMCTHTEDHQKVQQVGRQSSSPPASVSQPLPYFSSPSHTVFHQFIVPKKRTTVYPTRPEFLLGNSVKTAGFRSLSFDHKVNLTERTEQWLLAPGKGTEWRGCYGCRAQEDGRTISDVQQHSRRITAGGNSLYISKFPTERGLNVLHTKGRRPLVVTETPTASI